MALFENISNTNLIELLNQLKAQPAKSFRKGVKAILFARTEKTARKRGLVDVDRKD